MIKMTYLDVLLVLILLSGISGDLNLYLDVKEVQKLLGLEAELYYIRHGVINQYALNFIIPVPNKVEAIRFTWESLNNQQTPYSLAVRSSSPSLLTPTLDIPFVGTITGTGTPSGFTVGLQCSANLDDLDDNHGEVEVTIVLNITLVPGNVTGLVVRRKKACYGRSQNEISLPALPVAGSPTGGSFYVAMCSAMTTVALLAAAAAIIHCTRHNRNTKTTITAAVPTRNFAPSATIAVTPDYTRIDRCSNNKDLPECISELTMQRRRVRLDSVTLEGTFGRVYRGWLTKEDNTECPVIVKTVTEAASQSQIRLLLHEGTVMHSLIHPNVLTLLRVALEHPSEPLGGYLEAPYILYPDGEDCDGGRFVNLKLFLQGCRLSAESHAPHLSRRTLTTQEVVDMALQVIDGLRYMHERRLLHRDVASRNCVVQDTGLRLHVRIADSALSRDLFPADYHCLGDNENRPVKWLALESLRYRTFTTSSDVWAFGVLLWELTTLAQQPYLEVDPFEIAAYLSDGYRLAQPLNCPDELFAVMAYCWAMSAEERPTVTQLQVCLRDFYAQLTRYV